VLLNNHAHGNQSKGFNALGVFNYLGHNVAVGADDEGFWIAPANPISIRSRGNTLVNDSGSGSRVEFSIRRQDGSRVTGNRASDNAASGFAVASSWNIEFARNVAEGSTGTRFGPGAGMDFFDNEGLLAVGNISRDNTGHGFVIAGVVPGSSQTFRLPSSRCSPARRSRRCCSPSLSTGNCRRPPHRHRGC
jgi:parallel beta-helix repeat protein